MTPITPATGKATTMRPPEPDPVIKATAATFTYLAAWFGTDDQRAELRKMASAVLDIDTRDICCPVCQEIRCDNDCPLYPVRLGWGCWVTPAELDPEAVRMAAEDGRIDR